MPKASSTKVPISLSKLRLNRMYKSCIAAESAIRKLIKRYDEEKKTYTWGTLPLKNYKAALSDMVELRKFMERYDAALRGEQNNEDEDDDW